MSIRKYLCREFDREDKGYVTVEDITNKVFSGEFIGMTILCAMATACIILIICLVGELYNHGLTQKVEGSMFDFISFNNFITGFIIFSLLTIVILILIKLWKHIKTFKVVVCPLKQKEVKKE